MKAPRLRAWNPELKIMELPEDIYTKENIHMILNKQDYIWMRAVDLKDKNGIEVYEGDILLNKHNNCFAYLQLQNQIPIRAIHKCKIIGNIYENPELMENNNELSRLR